MSFADTFAFARPVPAPYVGADGSARTAAPDVPRFDYAGPQRPLGLLVATVSVGMTDRVILRPRDWSAATEWTVLHEWQTDAGLRRDAYYTPAPQVLIDAVLRLAGHHRRIAVVPGYLKRYDDWVWASAARWTIASPIGDGRGVPVSAEPGSQPLLG